MAAVASAAIRATQPLRAMVGARRADAQPRKRTPAEQAEIQRREAEAAQESKRARLERARMLHDEDTNEVRVVLAELPFLAVEIVSLDEYVRRTKEAGFAPRRGLLYDASH
ncbi:MAG: hypothetical protein JNK11_12750 [Alphaproteobacteria bacterium]|nr:hypothetical protein [Alphaproteobacteria bacterium]